MQLKSQAEDNAGFLDSFAQNLSELKYASNTESTFCANPQQASLNRASAKRTLDEKENLEETKKRLRIEEFAQLLTNYIKSQNERKEESTLQLQNTSVDKFPSVLQRQNYLPPAGIPSNVTSQVCDTPSIASDVASSFQTPALLQLDQNPDLKTLESNGFDVQWFSSVVSTIVSDLNEVGICAIDNFFGSEKAEKILQEVKFLYSEGVFQEGQLVSNHFKNFAASSRIRGDKTTWLAGNEPCCPNISLLINVIDVIIRQANRHQNAACLAPYNLSMRTKAMVACYPGHGSRYVRHVDNPNGDGRCITAIYYVNKGWLPQDGGILKIYPRDSTKIAEIDPRFDRMLFFWSDRRNPHEVLPSHSTRYAVTIWYLDQREREAYLARRRAPV